MQFYVWVQIPRRMISPPMRSMARLHTATTLPVLFEIVTTVNSLLHSNGMVID